MSRWGWGMVFFALATAGCGGAKTGGSCSAPEGTGTCTSADEALICESGEYRAIPCRGAGGCVSDGSRFICDLRAVDGDPCPASAEGSAQCDPSNPDGAFSCSGGVWFAQSCLACSVTAGQVTCLAF